jgi:adenosine kinase
MNKKIIVAGSLVYDRIMFFQDRFKDHILAEKTHILNVGFYIKSLHKSFGGTAGNVAYNLSLLNEKPIILGVAGKDFFQYQKRLENHNIDSSLISISKKHQTAKAYIITDQDDNQISAFYTGTSVKNKNIRNLKADFAIVSPDNKERMIQSAQMFSKNKIPFILDPGQQITSIEKNELQKLIKQSYGLIGNDYEIELILNKLKINLGNLRKRVKILFVTRGSEGSVIYNLNKKILVKAAKPLKLVDPTGAGDAYRAGLIKGMVYGLSLEQSARLASTVAVYAVEKQGTQNHKFNLGQIKKRYCQNYDDSINL